ncbi:MAG: hypothetical protein FD149_2802 [Rhodospirillaceae bacterium]|nr:MAG: hypothetical protein FD149_2802 [Rhodospirillaceae bacterium]
MLEQYIETTQPLIEALLAALHAKDYPTVRKKAHFCSGASKTAGAWRLANFCSTIEKAVMADDPETAQTAGGQVADAFTAVVKAVEAGPAGLEPPVQGIIAKGQGA